MELVRTHKLPLAIGYCLLVASIFFPFATQFLLFVNPTPTPSPYIRPLWASRSTFWSFMHVNEALSKVGEGSWVATSVQWLFLPQYWDWWMIHANILIPILILQGVAVLLGLATLLKANTAKKILPLLLAALALNLLYFAGSQVLQSEVFIGFWLSILSTASIMTAVAYTRLLTRTPANTSELRGG